MNRIDECLKSLVNKSKDDMRFSQKKEHTCPSEETIACYLDNLLTDTEREYFEEHITKCDDCLQQTIMLHSLRKEIKENGYMVIPTETTGLTKEIIPESSIKSLIEVVLKFVSNTIRAKRGYRLELYGSIALIVMLSVGIYSVMVSKPTVSPYDNGIYKTRGTTSTPLDELTGQVEVETSLELSMNIIGQRKDIDGSVSKVIIEEGSILQYKDEFRVQFETNKNAYVYILIYDSLNKANLLFPDSNIPLDNMKDVNEPKKEVMRFVKGEATKVKANESYTTIWFLDENIGIEAVYVLASESPLDNIKDFLPEMEDVADLKKKIMKFAIDNNSAFKTISFRRIGDKAL